MDDLNSLVQPALAAYDRAFPDKDTSWHGFDCDCLNCAMARLRDALDPAENEMEEEGWSSIRITFTIESEKAVQNVPAPNWPSGWKLVETATTTARQIAVFTVDHLPTAIETRAIQGLLHTLK